MSDVFPKSLRVVDTFVSHIRIRFKKGHTRLHNWRKRARPSFKKTYMLLVKSNQT